MRRTESIVAVILVVSMLLGVFALGVTATENDETEYGELAFEETFDDPSRIMAVVGNAPSDLRIEGGKLKVTTDSITSKSATRIKLFDIPEGVTNYTAVMEAKANGKIDPNARETRYTVGLIFGDNWLTNLPESSYVPGQFQMFWGRPEYASGTTSYGFTSQRGETSVGNCFAEGVEYIVTVHVDLTFNLGVFDIVEKASGVFVASTVFELEDGLVPSVGLFFNGTDNAEVDAVRVYTQKITDNIPDLEGFGRLAFREDFDDESLLESYKSAVVGNVPSEMKIEDGKLKVTTDSVTSKSATRIKLFDIPDGVTAYIAVMEVKTNGKIYPEAMKTRYTVGLIIGDNGLENDPEGSEIPGQFQMFWGRPEYASGMTSYGFDPQYGSRDIGSRFSEGKEYVVIVSVDLSYEMGDLMLVDKNTGVVFNGGSFELEEGLVPSVGLFFNGTDNAEVDSVSVYTDENVLDVDLSDYGTLAFEENFEDDSVLADYQAGIVGNHPTEFKMEEGKLKVTTSSLTSKSATRVKLFDIPENVTEYTAVMGVKANGKIDPNAISTRYTVGLIIGDNGLENDPDSSYVPGQFQMFWGRPEYASGMTSYGFDPKYGEISVGNCFAEGTEYIVVVTVDLYYGLGELTVAEKKTGGIVAYDFFTVEEGLVPSVGLFFNGTDNAEVDSVRVYIRDEYMASNDEYEFVVSEDKAEIFGYYGNGGDIVIPSEFDGKPVTAVQDFSFLFYENITSLTVPNSVSEFGEFAFFECNDIPKVLFIGTRAEWNSKSYSSSSLFANLTVICTCPSEHSFTDESDYSCNECDFIKEPNRIEITTKPAKLEYVEGEELDKMGMIVTAYYDNNISVPVTEYTISGYSSTVGTKTVTVTFVGKTADFNVIVKSKAPSAVTSSTFTVSGTTVSKINAGTTVSALLSGLNEGTYCKVYSGNAEVSGNSTVGTGMVVKIMDGNTEKASYNVVVTGDTNGDGNITVTDMIAIKADVLKKSTLSGVYATAADTNSDGGVSITDFIQVKAKILGKGTITAR